VKPASGYLIIDEVDSILSKYGEAFYKMKHNKSIHSIVGFTATVIDQGQNSSAREFFNMLNCKVYKTPLQVTNKEAVATFL
jgi:superfamily II DNA or RNA helicase